MKLLSPVLILLFCTNLMANNIVVRCTDSEGNSKNHIADSVEVTPEGTVLIFRNIGRGGRPLARASISNNKCIITPEVIYERPSIIEEPN